MAARLGVLGDRVVALSGDWRAHLHGGTSPSRDHGDNNSDTPDGRLSLQGKRDGLIGNMRKRPIGDLLGIYPDSLRLFPKGALLKPGIQPAQSAKGLTQLCLDLSELDCGHSGDGKLGASMAHGEGTFRCAYFVMLDQHWTGWGGCARGTG